jgi:uncharacterized protein YbbC (DUF1343 family)
MVNTVISGLDRLLASGRLRGMHVGLVCNPASVDAHFCHAIDQVSAAGVTLAAVFGPQHGFRSDVQDNMIETGHATDERRRVPIYSLYSETREPTAEMLRGLDVLVVDLQDVGTRVYTYIYTMANCMRAGHKHGVPIIVCDRPNPVGGDHVEGPVLETGFESFVGQFPIPLRHGMTIGELARLFNDAFGIGADLFVEQMNGWRREMWFDETGFQWVMPSPNIPTLDSATVYPGAVLFEGTNLSEGRGTTRPFELIGAPWIEAERLCEELNAQELSGVHFRPVVFEPTFHKHSRQACGGCQTHVTDRRTFCPVKTTVTLIDAFNRADSDRFGWKEPPYEYEYTRRPIDLLYGSDRLRDAIAAGTPPAEIAGRWEPALSDFIGLRSQFLLYS